MSCRMTSSPDPSLHYSPDPSLRPLYDASQQDSLKLRISELTGIPVEHQRIWHAQHPCRNPMATLRRAGVGHGSELLIRCRVKVHRVEGASRARDGVSSTLLYDVHL